VARTHLIGLLLGMEEDWSTTFEELLRRLDLSIDHGGDTHRFATERITIEPFDLRATPRYDLVVDRLAHWYYVPREWLKKVALMDGVYLMNNPFTFQAMEKHAAYCAMMRLGLEIPDTWLIPHKDPPEDSRFAYTSSRYSQAFDLDAIAERIGYPLYMKPYDGGAWVGVSRIEDGDDLRRRYDESGRRIMHLQEAVDFDVFVRSLSIGGDTMVMRFDPDRPNHDRYQIDHGFLTPELGQEVLTIGRTVNAFFRWEFNSCETLVAGDTVKPIDYANACPDVSLTSLHYYFPWAMKALVRWSVFCTTTRRDMRINLEPTRWFEIADDPDRDYGDKLAGYAELARDYFDQDAYEEFCATHLGHLDELAAELVDSSWFDDLLVRTVRSTFPEHEHEHFVAHYRGLMAAWLRDQPLDAMTNSTV
jgi:hypothetical protein